MYQFLLQNVSQNINRHKEFFYLAGYGELMLYHQIFD